MATYVERRSTAAEAEPLGLLTEGAAGIATIVLAVVALAGVAAGPLAAIAAIVIGVGLLAQAFNSAAEDTKAMAASPQNSEFGGEVMVDCLCGVAGIILGILALVGAATAVHMLAPALIVFGGALLLSGSISMRPRSFRETSATGQTQVVAYHGSAAASGMEVLIGLAAIVLGILSLTIAAATWPLVLVGFIAVGAAMLLVSATFSGAVVRLFTTA
jgi:hypothetical protein